MTWYQQKCKMSKLPSGENPKASFVGVDNYYNDVIHGASSRGHKHPEAADSQQTLPCSVLK